jgi:poly-gamma-glutamate synthesis protein (capsule biosynthesis protein)
MRRFLLFGGLVACMCLTALLAGCTAGLSGSIVEPADPTGNDRPAPLATRSGGLQINLGGSRPVRVFREADIPAYVEAPVRLFFGETPVEFVPGAEEADLRLGREGTTLVYEQIMTPGDRFSSVLTGIGLDELKGAWSGALQTPNFTTIYPDASLMPALELLLGPPSGAVRPVPPGNLTETIWGDPMGLVILPFEALTPSLLALRLDGQSVVDNRLDQRQWPLALRGYLTPLTPKGEAAVAEAEGRPPISNRDPDKLTVLVMTGVTAMARGTAAAIERAGDYAFPARLIGPELAAADITIISNEIPFVEGCVVNNTRNNLILCSKPEYFATLKLSGADAVGLSGNHQNDFGYTNMLESLDFYGEMGAPVYGGGADEEAALAPLFLEHNGNRLAFLGANQYGPESYVSGAGEAVSAWAGADHPGSARFDLDRMRESIQALRPGVDLVLAEVQHTEFDAAGNYTVAPIPGQLADFQALADAGADVVTGVQAHAPQAVELRDDGIILYGLGNLYFDQTWSWRTRTGLIPRHAIYDGRLLNTELLVSVIEPDMQLRWATPEERIAVLKTIFAESRW